MRFSRKAAVAVAAIVAAAVLSSCAPAASSDDEIITVNGFEPQSALIPADASDAGGYRILDQLFAGLSFYNAEGAAVNDIADTIAPNADNTVWTVSIKDDFLFTNGEAVTSESFTRAWDWAARSSNATVNRWYFSEILGFKADTDSSLVDAGGLVVVDDDTFEIHLTTPLADYPQRLGHIAYAPLPSVFYDDPPAFAQAPIGNGPYEFAAGDAWQRGERLELVANPDYEGEREPSNAGITMRFYDSLDVAYADLISGNLDVLDTLPVDALPVFKDELGRRWINQPVATLESITIPTTLAHFAGPEGTFRRSAISRAIDREGIIADLFGVSRVAARDFTSPALDGWSDSLSGAGALTFDKDIALEQWAEAEKLSPWEGTLELAYNADGEHAEWIQAVADSISSTLKIDVVAVPYPSLGDLQTAIDPGPAPSAYRYSWRADYPGVLAFIQKRFGTKASGNIAAYSSPAFDAALRLAVTAKSPTDLATAGETAQQTLLADLPTIPLWNSTTQGGYAEGISEFAFDWHGVPLYYLITKRAG